MGVLHGIERRLAGAVDYAFTRLFGGGVQPAEVTSALQHEAARQLRQQGDRTIAPNRFVVRLGPSDSSAVGKDAERVATAFGDMIDRYVDEHGWDTFGEVSVTFDQSDMLHTGQFRVSALIDPDTGSPRPTNRAGARSMTQSSGHGHDPGGEPYSAPPAAWPDAPAAPGYGEYQGYRSQDYQQAGFGHDPYAGNPAYPGHDDPAAHGPSQAFLTLHDGSGRTIQLQQGSNVLGRGQEATLRLADTSVSRRHADIYFDGRTAIVHDLGSTNGTTVNGAAIQTWQLADGDVIELGRCAVIVTLR